jgi:hypothetical protein
MARKRGIGNIVPDITSQLDRDFNAFIQLALEGLATKNNSPVYTGFFASSWKASTQRTKPTDRVQDFAPWSDLKKRRDKGDLSAFRIQPRFKVPEFNYRTKVFIGNATQYAAYALENPKVANFVQGELRSLIQASFSEKRGPQVMVGTSKGTGGLGFFRSREYVSYEKV